MKKFKYKWKIGTNETIGSKECEDGTALKTHIESLGGELLEILEQSEVIVRKDETEESLIGKDDTEAGTIFKIPESKKGFSEPSKGIKVVAGIYCLPTVFVYIVLLVYLFNVILQKGIMFNNELITKPLHILSFFIIGTLAASIPAILGIGLLLLRKWARIVVIIFSCLEVLNAVVALFSLKIILPIWGIFILWFLNIEEIKEQFE